MSLFFITKSSVVFCFSVVFSNLESVALMIGVETSDGQESAAQYSLLSSNTMRPLSVDSLDGGFFTSPFHTVGRSKIKK